ncbi:UbiA family prenyltransferase [bacterium]|nr:UbiA family prenyltransferase [bacterium]
MAGRAIENTDPVPLVVDVDGTLIRSDLLIEAVCRLVATRPFVALRLPLWALRGRGALKSAIADRVTVDPSSLPLVDELVAYVRAERAAGRPVYLASASDRRQVEALASHLGLFDGVFGSDATGNLKGSRKADRLVHEFGEGGFDYAGDAPADLAVWKRARKAIAVNCGRGTRRALGRSHQDIVEIAPRRTRFLDYLRAIRVHQWAKNGLLLLPMLTSHAIDLTNLALVGLGIVAFSLVASSVYLTNDLLDLPADRDHATKRRRPLASGAVPILHGLLLAPVFLLAGMGMATLVSPAFLGVVLLYFVATLAYSLVLKRQPVVDVLTLAGLYTLRAIAGGAAIGITLSAWLLAFSMFLFLCLALVKRHTELKSRQDAGKGDPRGRGYRLADIPVLESLAAAAGYAAVVVLALYVNSDAVVELYARPWGLWLACVLLLYWVSRVLLITHRGEMNDDPVVFALKDRTSVLVVLLVVLVALTAAL